MVDVATMNEDMRRECGLLPPTNMITILFLRRRREEKQNERETVYGFV